MPSPAQFTFSEAAARRDDGIARAEEHALESWKVAAWDALVRYLRANETMHVDDLAPLLPSMPGDRRALGPVFLRAVREGLMVKTGEYRPSVSSNLSPKPCWRSLVFRGSPP